MKKKERKGNKQANKQHPKKKRKSDSVYFPLYPVDKID
jgi:hypothetical protein